jgi:integrase
MTESAIEAAEKASYSVMEYKRGGKLVSWLTKIGYKVGKEGERVRAWQYHSKDYGQALAAALEIGAKWEAIVEDYRKRRDQHNDWVKQQIQEAIRTGYYVDEHDNKVDVVLMPNITRPLPPGPFQDARDRYEILRQEQLKNPPLEVYRAMLARSAPPPPVWPTETDAPISKSAVRSTHPKHDVPLGMTIGKAKDKYIAEYKSRVGLKAKRGIKEGSALIQEAYLKIVFKQIDENTPLASFGEDQIKEVVNYYQSSELELSQRTRSNYVQSMLQFLKSEVMRKLNFTMPHFDENFFAFHKVTAENVKYNKVQIKTLINAVDDRCKLFQLLALNCGFLQVDICNLKLAEIVELNGDTYIARKRDKTSHQNDFATQWYLWPETAKLLKKHLAAENKWGLALLHPKGGPMMVKRRDYVTVQWRRVALAQPVTAKGFSYKQYRKIGVSAVKRISGNPDIARKYAAQKIAGVLADYDRDDFFGDLTETLKKWHAELKADEVL